MSYDSHIKTHAQPCNKFIIFKLIDEHSISHLNPLFISLVGGGGKTSTAFWLAKQFKNHGYSVCITTTTKMYLPENKQADLIECFEEIMISNHISNQLSNRDNKFSTSVKYQNPSMVYCFKNLLSNPSKMDKQKVSGLTDHEIIQLKNKNIFSIFIIEADGAHSLPIKAPHRHEPCIPVYSDIVMGVVGAEAINHKAIPEQIHRWPDFTNLTQCQAGDVIDAKILQPLISRPLGLFKSSPNKAKQIWLINKMDKTNDSQVVSNIAQQVLINSPKLDSVWLTEMQSQAPIKKIILRNK